MLKRPLIAAAAMAAALLSSPLAALAHANLVQSTPAANSSSDSAPEQISLTFSERPEAKLSQVQVFNADRQRIDDGPLSPSPGDPSTLIERLKPELAQGVYTVSWQTTSAVDGHVTGGAFAFGLGVAPNPADVATLAAPPEESQGWADAVIRWLGYVAIVTLFGLVLFEPAVLQPALADAPPQHRWGEQVQAIRQRCLAASRPFAALAVLAALATILGQASRSSALDAASIQATVQTAFGQLLLARFVLAVIVLGLIAIVSPWHPSTRHRSLGAAAAVSRPAWAVNPEFRRASVTALLLAELLLFAGTSHALGVSNAPELALFVDWFHLAMAGIWVGGLVTLALLISPLRRAQATPDDDGTATTALFPVVLRQFSRLALLATAGIALTGLYQAFIHVGSFDNVLTTDYGRTLLIKTGIFASALALAATHRFFVLPALGRMAGPPKLLNRTLPLEAFLGIAILGATGVLMGLSPANEETSSGRVFTKSLPGDVQLSFQVQPLRLGPNIFQVTLRKGGQPVTDADKVEIQLQHTEMDMGLSVVDLNNAGGGVYSASSDALGMSGRWRAEMLVRLPGQFDQRPEFDIDVSSQLASGPAGAPIPATTGASAGANQPGPAGAVAPASQLSSVAGINSALPRPGDLTLGGSAGSTLVGLTLRTGAPGANQILVYVLPPDGESAAGTLPVSLAINGPADLVPRTGRLGWSSLRRADARSGTFHGPSLLRLRHADRHPTTRRGHSSFWLGRKPKTKWAQSAGALGRQRNRPSSSGWR